MPLGKVLGLGAKLALGRARVDGGPLPRRGGATDLVELRAELGRDLLRARTPPVEARPACRGGPSPIPSSPLRCRAPAQGAYRTRAPARALASVASEIGDGGAIQRRVEDRAARREGRPRRRVPRPPRPPPPGPPLRRMLSETDALGLEQGDARRGLRRAPLREVLFGSEIGAGSRAILPGLAQSPGLGFQRRGRARARPRDPLQEPAARAVVSASSRWASARAVDRASRSKQFQARAPTPRRPRPLPPRARIAPALGGRGLPQGPRARTPPSLGLERGHSRAQHAAASSTARAPSRNALRRPHRRRRRRRGGPCRAPR